MIQIVTVDNSPLKNKRFRAILSNGKHIDFGSPNGKTYIDGASDDDRLRYIARHYGNKTEKERIDNLTPSSSVMSAFLLWGYYDTLEKNIQYLNGMWKEKGNHI
jgi:hypothetical protein